jgi:hypothetical protein
MLDLVWKVDGFGLWMSGLPLWDAPQDVTIDRFTRD